VGERRDFVLVVEAGPDEGTRYPLRANVVTLGRDADNVIVVDDRRISRYHARLRISPAGTVLLEDLDSTNGTFLQGRPVTEPVRLVPGASFTLADAVRFRLTSEAPVSFPEPAAREGAFAPRPSLETAVFRPEERTVEPEAPARAGRWLYALVLLLALLVCLCFALAVYLWMAPSAFWEGLLEYLGLPLP
jgi:hypothetical protein